MVFALFFIIAIARERREEEEEDVCSRMTRENW